MSDFMPGVLFATDFSDGAEPAAAVAADLARRFGAHLHVLHVTHHGWESEMLETLRGYADRFTDLPVTASVETGSPAERIVAHADRHGVKLIVLGAHGRTGFSRALLGSVAERVARTAHCPVVTVPREGTAEPRRAHAGPHPVSEPPPPPLRCVVCDATADELICAPCRARVRGAAGGHARQHQKMPV